MNINEVVVISGKGGTGKTTLVSSLIPFFKDVVIADCDVDAPDLHIMFNPKLKEETPFVGLKKAFVDDEKCIKCGKCYEACKYKAISKEIVFNHSKCEGCSVCEFVCPVQAIEMKDVVVGKLSVSETKYGDLVHARLIPGEDASGKLVSEVRKKAKEVAKTTKIDNIIIDGSPGVACNVISSITGASKAIIVVEPTLSGLHDLERVYELTKRFNLKVFVVINKYDLSPNLSARIEEYCCEQCIEIGLKIPFTKKIVQSIVSKKVPSLNNKALFEKIGFGDFIRKIIK